MIASGWLLAGSTQAQSFRPMRYLDEIGHLGTDYDLDTSARIGTATVSPTETGALFRGFDRKGNPWTVATTSTGGIGWTDVWQADFDRDSQQDLLIAELFPANGRGCQEVKLTFLLFDAESRPVPWTVETNQPFGDGPGNRPAILEMHNANHHAELIVTSCEYSASSNGIEFQIRGVYEAEKAHWKLIRPLRIGPYFKAVQTRLSRGRDVTFLKPDQREWLDVGNAIETSTSRPFISSVLRHDPKCRVPIKLEIVDEHVRKPVNDPCEVLEHDRLQMSDGAICFGWPSVVIDHADKREIVMDDSSIFIPPLIESRLREVALARLPVISFGQSDPKHCSPTLLWVDQRK